jgi:D-alanine-D-alanine ligase
VKRLRIGIVYGGRSGEHEVSIASAASVFANLDKTKYEPIAIRIEKDGRWMLSDRPPSAPSAADVIEQMRDATRVRGGREVILPPRPGDDTLVLIDRRPARAGSDETAAVLTGLGLDVIFPVLHGPYGEDGTIQGLLELAGIAYVGCGVLASAVGMDKGMMKALFQAAGLTVAPWIIVRDITWANDRAGLTRRIGDALTYPLFVKPANLGSSVGISKVKTPDELPAAVELALTFDPKVVVESAVPGAREIECAVLGNDTPTASIPGEIIPDREFYDYESKYISSGSRTVVPAALDAPMIAEVQRQSLVAFNAIEGAGLARVDFLLSSSGELVINEINTMPGFTTISMYPKLWGASGVDYAPLIDRLITFALERHARQQQRRTSAF